LIALKASQLKKNHSIEVTNLFKKYRLGSIGMTSLREDLSRWWNRKEGIQSDTFSSNQPTDAHSRIINDHEFWALNDINLEIKKGEVIGLIGANGSGKSTFLKILSRITEPSAGQVKVRGKVASLLEVGTGFHPELTGRENIYINGAILGMTRKEVDRKFDAIVDFAGVEDFIETPIKRYSSGMTVRLGFAVAAHLDPDILIVDEVLAVGDAAFQKKCLGKMENISTQGRTIIFVSHQLPMIEALCNRSYLLDKGHCSRVGPTKEVIDFYLSSLNIKNQDVGDWNHRQGNGLVKLINISIRSSSLGESTTVKVGEEVSFVFEFKTHDKSCKFNSMSFRFAISNHLGHRVTTIDSRSQNCVISRKREFSLKVDLPKVNFPEGTYFITTFIGEEETPYDWIINAHRFNVIPGNFYGTGRINTVPSGEILSDFKISQINAQNTN
jgi:lipopolysaccharide transport system ATP-binding protein